MDLELLRERAHIFRQIRAFFDSRGYLETDTPLLSPNLIPESCLEVFETAYLPPPGSAVYQAQPYWLIPSPEIWMKRLIAQHRVSLYQICKCFRNGESTGRLHSPEFTMLEYYTMDADYLDSLTLTEELFAALLSALSDSVAPETLRHLSPPFERITMSEAFSRWAGIDLYAAAETPNPDAAPQSGSLAACARRLGLAPPAGLDTAALYDLIFIHAVEPNLPRDRPVAILDYPAFVPCLAKKSPDRKTAERWELYVRGIELANCYSEETDPGEVRRYFEAEAKIKNETASVPHAVDEDYWKLFCSGGKTCFPKGKACFPKGKACFPEGKVYFPKGKACFPQCSGVAMGLDRLVMALTGRSTIDGVLPFPMRPA